MIYTIGNIAVSGNTLTGTGTNFKAPLSMIRVGCTVIVKSDPIQIFSITEIVSETELSVTPAASPNIPAGTAYSILLCDSISVDGLAQNVAETLLYCQSIGTEVADYFEMIKECFGGDSVEEILSDIRTATEESAANAEEAETFKIDAESAASAASASAAQASNSATELETLFDEFNEMLGVLGSGSALPVGVPVPWPSATPPTGWLKCNGATFDKMRYPHLATAYPSGKLPDLRGEFIRGWDDGRGIDAGRALLSIQTGMLERHRHIVVPNNAYDTDEEWELGAIFRTTYTEGRGLNAADTGGNLIPSPTLHSRGSIGNTGGSETRPRNIAFNYIVRAA